MQNPMSEERATVVAALRMLADALEAEPDLPVPITRAIYAKTPTVDAAAQAVEAMNTLQQGGAAEYANSGLSMAMGKSDYVDLAIHLPSLDRETKWYTTPGGMAYIMAVRTDTVEEAEA